MRHHGVILVGVSACLCVATQVHAAEPEPAVTFSAPTGDQMLSMGNDMRQGYRFRVREPIVVTEIGWFVDPRYLQLNADHPVGIYGSSGQLLASGVVPKGAPGVLVGNFRYVPLAAPLPLHPGTFTVVGFHQANKDVTCHIAPAFAAHDAIVFEAPVEQYWVSDLGFTSGSTQTIGGGSYRFGPSFRFHTHRPEGVATIGDDVPGIMYEAGSALTPDGGLVVGGYGVDPSGATSLRMGVVARFDHDGTKVGETWVEGGDGGDFYANAVAVDSAGAAVIGGTWVGGNAADLLIVKLAADGTEAWRARYAGALSWGLDTVGDITIDQDDNVIAVGWTEVQGQSYNVLLRKYAPAGDLVWSTTWDGPGHMADMGTMVHVGPGGVIWVSGQSATLVNGSQQDRILVARFQDSGATVALVSAEALPGSAVWPRSKSAIDPAGNVYVAGYFREPGKDDVGWVARRGVDGSGWERTTATTRWSYLYGVAADAHGHVFVTGSNHDFQSDNVVTFRLDAATGEEEWLATFHTFSADYGFDVVPDGRGGAFVAGQSGFHGASEEYDALAIHYDRHGVEAWASTWDGPAHVADDAHEVHFAGDRVMVVGTTGWSQANAERDLVVLTYHVAPVVDDDGDGVPDEDDVCAGHDDLADGDGDGTADGCDACPGDPYDDGDGDGLCGDEDPCPLDLANDADADGLCEGVDNCPGVANDNQSNVDGDAYGDACEPDDDGDGVIDDGDNCPLDDNPDQADVDDDGVGNACDDDDDGDGVVDRDDTCLGETGAEPVLDNGCTVAQQCACDGAWKNHGAYVTCVGRAAESLRALGRIARGDRDAYVSRAGASRCGR
ncbi:MAG: hypothetical protein IT385_27295 [Deltaproteobacteria bacterium]|nr:hypothetical protein [Deltaproteobacteria bacterium]